MYLSPCFKTVSLPLVSLSFPWVFFWALNAAAEVAAHLRPVMALARVCILQVVGGDVARKW